jgi:hypothetical protein
LAAELRRVHPPHQKWPDLRDGHRCLIHSPAEESEQYALVNVEADRMTNSLNTLREEVEQWRRLTERC